ncbi:MAG: FIST C-terminal domain-containing protein, partial [Candidatus Desantisbacteria bacterium]
SAVGILWTGGINFGIGIRHGWKPLGRPRQVTAAHRNIIKTIENKPAVNVYEDYFGKKIKELRYPMLARMAILYPLGIYLAAEHDYILRNVLGVLEDGSLIFQGDIPQGSEIRIMIGTKESALEAAKEAAQEAKAALSGRQIKTALIFDSISRNKLLGRAAFSEIEIVKDTLGKDVPIMGFYTYGELAPLKALDYRGESYFHNETINIFALGG